MNVELVRTFRFDAAHRLTSAPEGHKCRRMHGHSYRVDVHVSGQVDPERGWLIDFGELRKTVQPLIDELDHRDLGDVPGLTHTTSEYLAKFLWDRIAPDVPQLSAVTVWESDNARCVYRGQ